jgi:hypothetical protein
MNDILPWVGIIGAGASLGTIIKFWMDIGVTRRNAESSLQKVESLATELSQFRITVAREYASTQSLADSERRLAIAIDAMRTDVRTAISDLTSRLDRVLNVRGHGD